MSGTGTPRRGRGRGNLYYMFAKAARGRTNKQNGQNKRSLDQSPNNENDVDGMSEYGNDYTVSQLTRSKKRVRVQIDNSKYCELPMCSVAVRLPPDLKPYPTQKLMMVRIIMALKTRVNLLAESPTGSGKTMALLASTCAWLSQYQREKNEAYDNCALHGAACKPTFVVPVKTEADTSEIPDDVIDLTMDENCSSDVSRRLDPDGFEVSLYDEFEKDFIGSPAPDTKKPATMEAPPMKMEASPETLKAPECTCLPRVRVYYGTRTHKQIGQVVKEFGRLPYAGLLHHTIMASREQSCINEAARRAPDLTGYCKELLAKDGIGCMHKMSMRNNRLDNPRTVRNHIERNGPVVFDMEDLVSTLAEATPAICPYFTSNRVLTMDADIVFCPFTYLVDPIIRNSSDVHIKNSVIILDEAHNIEDTCRESASFTFHEQEFMDAVNNIRQKEKEAEDALCEMSKQLISEERDEAIFDELTEMIKHYRLISSYGTALWQWMGHVASMASTAPLVKVFGTEQSKKSVTRDWAALEVSLQDTRLHRQLDTPPKSSEYKSFMESYHALMGSNNQEENEPANVWKESLKISGSTIVCLEKWMYFQEFFGDDNYRTTYRLNVTVEEPSTNPSFGRMRTEHSGPRNMNYNQTQNSWLDAKVGYENQLRPLVEGYRVYVRLWCMSPALAFMGAFKDARSVILASGTLCPADTLKTELGTEFKLQMEGDQVIPSDRIFASVLPVGPSGIRIRPTYSNLYTPGTGFELFRELALIIRSVCMSVPNGILCFLPNYRMLDKLVQVINESGNLAHIEQRKYVVCEPRRSSELKGVMEAYENAINNPQQYGPQCDGALMFAVFRGKVSEGIDFTDDKARVVLSIGIPYPNVTDELLQEKKKYNDVQCKTQKLLNGEQWYTTQAYRALNQALGRCLRHKNDWGAMILIDERLLGQTQQKRSNEGSSSARVSGWITKQLRVYNRYEEFERELREFAEKMSASSVSAGFK